jgi:hypothetical protein
MTQHRRQTDADRRQADAIRARRRVIVLAIVASSWHGSAP